MKNATAAGSNGRAAQTEDVVGGGATGGLLRRDVLTRGAAGVGAVAFGGLLSACGAGSKSATKLAGTTGRSTGGGKAVSQVTFGVEADAVSMDYTQTYDYAALLVVPSMTEELLRMDSAGRLHPNLATSYDTSDPHRMVFQIRRGVRFHDGTAMTAKDVAFSLNRHRDPDVASLMAFYFDNVSKIEATGPFEVTIFMKSPDAQLVQAMSMNAGAVTSEVFVNKHGKAFGSPSVGTMGTGPYHFVSWVKGQSFTVERNEDYWNGAAVPRKVKTVTAHVISDEATLIAALRAGQIDGQLAQISGRGIASLVSATNIQQFRTPCGGASNLDFNCARKPWDDARVRQAISLVIPRQGLLDSVWGGQGVLVKSIAPPPVWSYAKSIFAAAYAALPDYTAKTGPTSENIAKAQKLISAAGAHGATGKIWVGTAYDAQQAEAIQAAVAPIGVTLSVNQVTGAAQTSAAYTHPHPYDMVIGLTTPDIPDPANLLLSDFVSTQASNYSSFSNPQVDAWLNKQETLVNDPQQRARLLTQAQAIIVREQPETMLVSPYIVLSLRKGLGGYQLASPQFNWDCQMLGVLSGS